MKQAIRYRAIWVLLAAALGFGARGLHAAEPGRVDVTVDPAVPWEQLPVAVTEIVPGPDGRWWYRLAPDGGAVPTLEEQKAAIVREFGKADPQLPFVRAMAFEAGGRVWFAANSKVGAGGATGPVRPRVGSVVTLLGYDGREFIEYVPKVSVEIDPRSRHSDNRSPPAFCAGGAVFFSGPGCIVWWDGKRWEEKAFPTATTLNGVGQEISAYPEADGKGVLVFVTATGELWRWREGREWKCIASREWVASFGVPKLSTSTGLFLDAAHVRPDGVWLKTSRGLAYIPLGTPSKKLAALVKQLDDPESTRREAASVEIATMGPEIAGELQMAMMEGLSAEQMARLKQIPAAAPLEVLRGGEEGRKPMKLGDFEVRGVEFLHGAPDGSTLIGAELAGGEYRVIKIDKAGAICKLGDVGTFQAMQDPGPVMPGGDHSAWFLTFKRDESAGNLVDLNTGKVVRTLPAGLKTWPELVSGDGRSWYVARANRVYFVFHPEAEGAAAAPMPEWKP